MSDQGNPPESPYGYQPAPGSTEGGSYGDGSTGAGPYQSPYGQPATQRAGFFGALFDFSFTRFVTPMLVKVAYVLGMVGIGIAVLTYVALAFNASPGLGLVALILVPVLGLLYLAFWRMLLEFYLAVVRMSEDIHQRLPGAHQ